MESTASLWMEALGWMALGFVKFIVTPATAVAAGVPPWKAFLYAAGGAAAGLIAMRPVAMALFRWQTRRRIARGRPVFTLGRRRIVRIKLRFGLLGIAFIGGVIGVPVAGLIAFKYFGDRAATLPVLIASYTMWSALLTLLSTTAF